MVFSSSECIIWFTVFAAEFVVIVTVNLLTIILFIKNRSLRTRSMYLVISLTVADMLVGVLSGGYFTFSDLLGCRLIKLNLPREVGFLLSNFCFFFPLVSLTNIAVISLERFHATFRPFRHRLIKRWVYVVAIVVVWVFSCNCFSHLGDRVALFHWISPLHTGILLSFVFNCYLCFLHVHSVQVSFRNSSSAPFCSCFKTKKTNCHIVYNNFSIFTGVATIQYISFCFLVN